MPTVQIGPLTLHTNAVGWQRVEGVNVAGKKADGESLPAVVTGPDGLEIDLALFMSDEGEGQVHCPESTGVPPGYDRLSHGARMGVYAEDEDTWVVKQFRLLRYSASEGWGNPSLTTMGELDALLGSSAERLLRDLGAVDLGTKAEVLGTSGNDLAMRWRQSAGPELPLAAYTLTRVLAIQKVLSA